MTDKSPAPTRIWDVLGTTDPDHTKRFKRPGGFEGTAIKPVWIERKLTEVFGPCGIGWGFDAPQYTFIDGSHHEKMVYCTVRAWYVDDDKERELFGVGGDKIVKHIPANEKYNRPERWDNDDEALKKAYTDAIMNAFKHIGAGGDVHMGMFDSSKYVDDLREEIQREKEKANTITEAQWTKLTTMLEQSGADVKAFNKHFKVKSVKELPANLFDKASAMLERKMKEKATVDAVDSRKPDPVDDLDEGEIPY